MEWIPRPQKEKEKKISTVAKIPSPDATTIHPRQESLKMLRLNPATTTMSPSSTTISPSSLTAAIPHTKETFELFLHILTYTTILLYHTRRSAPVYVKTFNKRTSLPLLLHILAGLFEVLRYHLLAALHPSTPLTPTTLDLIACTLQSLTSLYLAKTLIRGSISTRPAYQAGALMRVALGVAAWASGDADLHRASVKIVNGFAYTRVVIAAQMVLGLDGWRAGREVYANGVFVGGLLAVWEAGVLGVGVPVYVGLVGVGMALNRGVSGLCERYVGMDCLRGVFWAWGAEVLTLDREIPLSPVSKFFVDLLVMAGFAELDTIKNVEEPQELQPGVKDVYASSLEEIK